MTDVTRVLSQIESGDPSAADKLLPLVYDELRRLAAVKMAQEKPGHTLQATALVHEAYLRLVADKQARGWDNRGHFFAAAAEAIRRILVEKARRRQRLRHGGHLQRQALDEVEPAIAAPVDGIDLLALNAALSSLEIAAPRKAQLVKLRYFAGCTVAEAAELLGVALSTAEADWTYAKTWLKREMEKM